MADSLRVDVREGAEELVDVELHFEDRHGGLHLVEEAGCPVDGFGDVFLNQVQIHLILLARFVSVEKSTKCGPFGKVRVERGLTRSPLE